MLIIFAASRETFLDTIAGSDFTLTLNFFARYTCVSTIAVNRTLKGLLEQRAKLTPQAPFLIFDDMQGRLECLDYAGFDAQVNRAARVLQSLGLEPGQTFNVHLSNCPAFLYLWFAAAKTGTVMMPTNVLASVDELEYLINHSTSRVIFTDAERFETMGEVASRCACVNHLLVCEGTAATGGEDLLTLMVDQDSTPLPHQPRAADRVGILYTSGTTARPKGVMVTNSNYLYAGETVARAIALRPQDRHLVVMPLFHGNAQYYSTMSALVSGASMALMARFSASAFFDQAITHKCTVSSVFAAPIRMILAQAQRPELLENHLRVVLFAQNVAPAQLDDWQQRFAAPLLQLWGMTETMGPPLMNPIFEQADNMSMGRPVMGYEVRLVNDEGAEVAAGEIGQIIVRGLPGETLMAGYLDNPQATAQTLRGGWLWSGDNARQSEDGFFHFVDRAKDMIKRSGENVAASEVEAVIVQHPGVFDCAVIGVPDAMRDEAIKAIVVLKPGMAGEVDAAAIIRWCEARLAKFRVPSAVAFREELPRTSVGKIQKHLLREI